MVLALEGDERAADRLRLVCRYVELAGGYDEPRVLDRSRRAADPLWVVPASRSL
jgi:hypothetical protein